MSYMYNFVVALLITGSFPLVLIVVRRTFKRDTGNTNYTIPTILAISICVLAYTINSRVIGPVISLASKIGKWNIAIENLFH